MYSRRHILGGAFALGLGGIFKGGIAWSDSLASKPVRAVLPSASFDTLGVKVLLDTPPANAPALSIDGRPVAGARMDSDGYSWGFLQSGLKPATRYELKLTSDAGQPLRAPWTLKTLPALDAEPESFRILFFTCAGGDPDPEANFLEMEVRRALLDRAVSFQPDLAIANGDHLYWDQNTTLLWRGDADSHAKAAALYRRIAWIDQDTAFDSETNRRSLNTIIGRQIAAVYEERFAEIPLVFVTDDHDYFENDNAGEWGYSFPPRPFVLKLQQRTAAMAYPFPLCRPKLAGGDLTSGTVEAIRIGKLVEIAAFDCRRGWNASPFGGVLFPDVEAFLIERLKRSNAAQYIHVPSNPMAWTAGKIGEWYEDKPPATVTTSDKGYWPSSWWDQHQRLVKALTSQRDRAAITISGDMHASGAKRVTSSGDIDLSHNSLEAILCGPIGTGSRGWPSQGRGMFPRLPEKLQGIDVAPTEERNGFTLFDVHRNHVDVRQFRWRPPEPVAAIASLQPHATFRIARRA
jgi:hypothetical protein